MAVMTAPWGPNPPCHSKEVVRTCSSLGTELWSAMPANMLLGTLARTPRTPQKTHTSQKAGRKRATLSPKG